MRADSNGIKINSTGYSEIDGCNKQKPDGIKFDSISMTDDTLCKEGPYKSRINLIKIVLQILTIEPGLHAFTK